MTRKQRSIIAIIVNAFKGNEMAYSGNFYATDITGNVDGQEVHFWNKLTKEEIDLTGRNNSFARSKSIEFTGKRVEIEIRTRIDSEEEEILLTMYEDDREFFGYDYNNNRFQGTYESRDEVSIVDPEYNWKKFLYRMRR